MTTERWLRLIAGTFVLTSVILGVYVNHWWLAFTAFVGFNLFQSGLTNFCPMKTLLEHLGTSSSKGCCQSVKAE
jgi:hypothetical protein